MTLLLHGSSGLVLGVHTGQFLSNPIVYFHELADAAVDTDGLSFAQVTLVVFGRDALLVTRLRQSV